MPSIFVRVWRLFYNIDSTGCLKKSELYRIEQGETAQENKGNILEKVLRAEEGGTS